MRLSLFSSTQCIIKQLSDLVFVMSGIIKVSEKESKKKYGMRPFLDLLEDQFEDCDSSENQQGIWIFNEKLSAF